MQGAEEDAAPQKLPRLFSPVTAAHQPHWHWLDWVRYFVLRHSLDALLVGTSIHQSPIKLYVTAFHGWVAAIHHPI
jgi:hypothetical protein